MISYNASHYQVPPEVIGKRILLKIKNGIIGFIDNDRLLAAYPVYEHEGGYVGDPSIIEQILQLRQEQRRSPYHRMKGKATRGLLVDAGLFPQVHYLSLWVNNQLPNKEVAYGITNFQTSA